MKPLTFDIPQEHICRCPTEYLLTGHLYLHQRDSLQTDLLILVLAALYRSSRQLYELPVFWICPLPLGVVTTGLPHFLFSYWVDFGHKMDFSPQDFRNSFTLFPELGLLEPSSPIQAKAKIIHLLFTSQKTNDILEEDDEETITSLPWSQVGRYAYQSRHSLYRSSSPYLSIPPFKERR